MYNISSKTDKMTTFTSNSGGVFEVVLLHVFANGESNNEFSSAIDELL